MPDVDDRLRALFVSDSENPLVHAECIRVARRLRQRGFRRVGLLPASVEVAIPPLGVQLGVALAELSGEPVALVDANLRWPFSGPSGEEVDDPGLSDSRAPPSGVTFQTRWVHETVAILAPGRAHAPASTVGELEWLINQLASPYDALLFDLTGLDQLGEHLAVMALLDGVLLVARAGATNQRRLISFQKQVPADKNLGVLLTG